jgi:hypothetical protein
MRRLETIQTVAKNSAACSVETSPKVIVANTVTGLPAAEPPANAAAMLAVRSQDMAVDFVLMVVCAGCFRWPKSAGGLYRHHAARSCGLLQLCFEIGQDSFVLLPLEPSF